MMASAVLVAVALGIASGPTGRSARLGIEQVVDPPLELEPEHLKPLTLADAPTTPTQAFSASLVTSFTGLVILTGLLAAPPSPGLPMSEFAHYSRLGAGLLLLSVGPSMGDLMNHDLGAFLVGAGGRTAMMALGVGAIIMAVTPGTDSSLLAVTILFAVLDALVWTGWSATDLVRSLFAPERWVERQNRARGIPDRPRSPRGVIRF